MELEPQINEDNLFYQAAIAGGVVTALTDAIPYLNLINCLCCLGIALGGVVAVYFFKTRLPQKVFTNAELFRLGLLTGMAGAFIAFMVHFAMFQLIGNWQVEWLRTILEGMDELPPVWDEVYEELQSPAMQGFGGLAILIRSLILFPIFTIGGAFWARGALERQKRG